MISSGSRVLRDDLGREVALDPAPRRVLSLVPSVTECLFDLGAGERVVGRTDYCVSPAAAVTKLPSVGGPKTIDPEAVIALRPDLVLANAEENDRDQVTALASHGLRVHVAFPRTLEGVARFLEQMGLLLRVGARASAAAAELRAAVATAPAPPIPAACLIWSKPYMAAGRDSLTSAIMAAAGAANVLAATSGRYPEIDLDALAATHPDVVLLPSEPYPFGDEDRSEVEQALGGGSALCCPGEWLTWYGCRMDAAIRDLGRLLAPYRISDATRP